jgi:hypothetical protein
MWRGVMRAFFVRQHSKSLSADSDVIKEETW